MLAAQQATDGMTPVDVVTLVVAIVGAVTGIAALVLQAVHFRASGPKVRCIAQWGWIHADGQSLITAPVGDPPDRRKLGDLRGYNQAVIAATATNHGRSPAIVRRIELKIDGVGSTVQLIDVLGPDLPYRLEGQDSAQWLLDPLPVAGLGKVMRPRHQTHPVHVVVELATGDTPRSGVIQVPSPPD